MKPMRSAGISAPECVWCLTVKDGSEIQYGNVRACAPLGHALSPTILVESKLRMTHIPAAYPHSSNTLSTRKGDKLFFTTEALHVDSKCSSDVPVMTPSIHPFRLGLQSVKCCAPELYSFVGISVSVSALSVVCNEPCCNQGTRYQLQDDLNIKIPCIVERNIQNSPKL